MSVIHQLYSSIQKQEQTPFSGYIISLDNKYLVIANTFTKEAAISYQNDWRKLISQNKILRVPLSSGENYMLGEKLNVYAVAWTASLLPIAVMLTNEKVME